MCRLVTLVTKHIYPLICKENAKKKKKKKPAVFSILTVEVAAKVKSLEVQVSDSTLL